MVNKDVHNRLQCISLEISDQELDNYDTTYEVLHVFNLYSTFDSAGKHLQRQYIHRLLINGENFALYIS